ncbi:hypothetical protein [Acuticoccus kandeliae]|uniref:hypothetical protein n=1 Tax=Acuticoccus kandeliae TaxID=2073160 RepID=UPI000D3E2912|nr:hypothetical protein [Acuticoccus kandeliae]
MKAIILAAATGFAILAIATSSYADPAVGGEQPTSEVELLIKTDNYLVPAHVCPDEDAEKYEDCVPRSHIGRYTVLVRPAQ